MVNDVPVATAFPPVKAVYQLGVEPVAQVAVKVAVLVPQNVAPVTVGATGVGLIVTIITFDSPI